MTLRNRLMGWARELTWRGQASVVLGLIAAVNGIVFGQLLLFRVAVLFLFLPLVCLLLVRRTRHELRATRRIDPPRLTAGEDAQVTVVVENNAISGVGLLLAADTLPAGLDGQTRFAIRGLAPAAVIEAQYRVHSAVRGRHQIGPLTLRLADPFGMCGLDRSISSTDELIVVPAVFPLPQLRLGAEVSGDSDNQRRPPPIASNDDLSVREYRRGDSLRRVNWRVTARRNELMVRQEEHPPQTRATLLLDSRLDAHRGEGVANSLEWAISAAASIGVHLVQRRFSLRVFNETGLGLGGLVHDVLDPAPGVEGQFLDGLAVLAASKARRLLEPGRFAGLGADGLLVAVVGEISIADAEELAARRRAGGTAIAVMLDVATWGGSGRRRAKDSTGDHGAVLRSRGWIVVSAHAGDDIAGVWQRAAGRSDAGRRPASGAPAPASPGGVA